MIVLDTHIWVWWVHGDVQLPQTHRMYLETQRDSGIRYKYYLLLGSGQVSRVRSAHLALPNCRVA
jgi:hypothetical protein